MFSGVSLADRLKAAVNQLEATGSQLQARAISASESVRASSAQSPADRPSRSSTPSVTVTGTTGTSGTAGASGSGPRPSDEGAKGYAGSTSHLAESALSGLRKSFNMARSSMEGSRPGTAEPSPSKEAKREEKELKIKDVENKPEAAEDKTAANGKGEDRNAKRGGSEGEKIDNTESDNKEDTAADDGPAAVETPEPAVETESTTPIPDGTESAPIDTPDELKTTEPTPEATSTPEPALSKSQKKNKKKKNKKKGKIVDKEEDDKDDDDKDDEVTKNEVPETTEMPTEEMKEEVKEAPKEEPKVEEQPEEEPKEEFTATPKLAEPQEPAKAEIAKDTSVLDEEPFSAEKPSKAAIESLKAAIQETKIETTGDPVPSPPPVVSPSKEDDPSKRLEDVERRFADLSRRYTELLSQTHSANKIFKELTPLESGIADTDALEGWTRMVTGKVEMITTELTRLQNKVALQESRSEEIRDTYRLESKSQAELIDKLRSQLSTAEGNLTTKAGDLVQMGQLRADLAKAQEQVKEEQEKRTKAISLLKTVRLKNGKLEKEKEEIERDRAEERAQRSRALEDVEKAKAEREREVNNLRKGFERELAGLKERSAKELASKKAAWELEMITTKASHAKELTNKTSKITGLEVIVKELHASNAAQFDTIQARQAEAESARSEMEVLQTRTKELEFQLRESTERLALLEDAPRGSAPEMSPVARDPGTSAAEVARLLAEAESRADQRVQDMRARVRTLERERNELEEDWASKLAQRVKELEALRNTIAEKDAETTAAVAARKERDARIDLQDTEKRELERQMLELRAAVDEAHADVAVAIEAERAARDELTASQAATTAVQNQLEEAKAVHEKLRQNNKTLRDELRKVQSATQLLERQRNPGVGYWAGNAPTTTSPQASGTPTPSSVSPPPAGENEEEVNLEYLRNVILQFLENKEMRPNLVRVLSVILRFTPQELRRLNAKLGT